LGEISQASPTDIAATPTPAETPSVEPSPLPGTQPSIVAPISNESPTEPSVEVVTQSGTVSVPNQGALDLLSSLHFTLGLRGGYDTNTGTSASQSGSFYTTESASVSYNFPGQQTQLDLLAGGALTDFVSGTSGGRNEVNSYLSLTVSHNYSTRLKLDASVYATYQAEPDFSSDAGTNNRQGNFFQTLDSLSAAYHWSSRLSTVTSYKFRAIEYDQSSVGTSTNRVENTFGQELRFNLAHKGTTLVGEYRFEAINYDMFAPRNSMTDFALAGVDEDFTSHLRLVARGGATFRTYNDDGSRTDPHFEGSLSYAGAHHSTLGLTASYGVEEPSSPQILSRTTFRTGLQVRYGLTARITLSGSGYYHHDQNEGLTSTGTGTTSPNFSQDSIDLSVDATYTINRHFSFNIGYEYSDVTSGSSTAAQTAGLGAYSRSRSFAGLTFTF
jgi:Putative beta-barrel porin 2